ncbi:glycoside hydrolase family 5 protein [Patescibacteria group bacterium]|nr:glycoside hydrolase family 5 protein [Patescibacteria group bacterium]
MKKVFILFIIILIIFLLSARVPRLKKFLVNNFSNRQNNNSWTINDNPTQINNNTNNNTNTNPDVPNNPIDGRDIFGLNTSMPSREALLYSLSKMDDLNIDKTRIWDNWILREPSQGQYDWSGLDLRINEIYNSGKEFILTIKPVGVKDGKSAWYCDQKQANKDSCIFDIQYEDDFALYIEAIAKRYTGKIAKIQFQNEWDSDYHFVGTGQDYVKYANILYEAVKKHSPETEVSLGSITKYPLLYLAGCQLGLLDTFYYKTGQLVSSSQRQAWCDNPDTIAMYERVAYVFKNARYDMVDVHFYDDPQYWDEYMEALGTLNTRNLPVIITEFGGPNADDTRIDAYDENVQASELQRYLDKIYELPVVEAYYFRLIEGEGEGINHPLTGLMKLIEGNSTPVAKQTYEVFKNRLK